MSSNEKAEIYNAILEKVEKIIDELADKLGRKETLRLLSTLVDSYDLRTASNLLLKDCEPHLDKALLAENQYSEGNEDAGYINLTTALGFLEEVLNCDDEYGNVRFQYFVRPETDEEAKENGHNDNCIWWVEDTRVKLEDLEIQFEM